MTRTGEREPTKVETAASDDPVDRLRSYLERSGSDAEVVVPPADAPTVDAAAAAMGVRRSQIVKSLLFESRQGDVILVVAGGESRVNRQVLADVAGFGHLKLASPERVLQVTGYAVGGMPPVGHESDLVVVVDRAVLEEPLVFGGGGRSDLLLQIRPDEIVRLTGASVASVCDQRA